MDIISKCLLSVLILFYWCDDVFHISTPPPPLRPCTSAVTGWGPACSVWPATRRTMTPLWLGSSRPTTISRSRSTPTKTRWGGESATGQEREEEKKKWGGKTAVGLLQEKTLTLSVCSSSFCWCLMLPLPPLLAPLLLLPLPLLPLLAPPAPTSPREIKSYHLIDLSALDSPQTLREADSPPSFDSSPPLVSSHLDNSFHPVPDFSESGKAPFEPSSRLFSVRLYWRFVSYLQSLVKRKLQSRITRNWCRWVS